MRPAMERPTPRMTSAAFSTAGNDPSSVPTIQIIKAKSIRSFQYFNFRFAFNFELSRGGGLDEVGEEIGDTGELGSRKFFSVVDRVARDGAQVR